MKILHICTGYDLDYNGGITNYVRNIAKSQSEAGIETHVLADGGKSDGYKVIPYTSNIDSGAYTKKTDKKSLAKIRELLAENDYDLIHIHMILNVDNDLFSVLKDYKYIISLHDYFYLCPRIQMIRPGCDRCEKAENKKCENCFSLLEKNGFILKCIRKIGWESFASRFPIKSKKIYRNWFEKYKSLLEGAKLLLPVSERVKEIYISSGIRNAYSVLHIGNISALTFDACRRTPSAESKINLVLLSSVSRVKGGALFFSMLKRIHNPNLVVHFYGRCGKKEAQEMEQLKIINHGPYKQKDLSEILKEMDMGVMTPIWEDNGPQVVMEMLNNHLPVFATKMGGITDFVDYSNGYIFDPFNEKETEAACNFLERLDRSQVETLRANIKRTTTPQEHADELLAKYKEVIDG